jgi:CTP synthase
MIELADQPFFIACQFHPEFKSRPLEAHPMFTHFVKAALEKRGVSEPSESQTPILTIAGEESV